MTKLRTPFVWGTILLAAVSMQSAFAAVGFREVQSGVGFNATIGRIERFLHQKGVPLMKVINHGAMARKFGIPLPPEELLIFGSPKIGGRLMQINPRVGLDLPLKVIVWCQTGACTKPGEVRVGFNRPSYLAHRFSIPLSQPIIVRLHMFFSGLAKVVAKP